MGRYFIFILLTFLAVSCSDFKLPDTGKQGKPCFNDGSCRDGLECIDGICVHPDSAETDDEESDLKESEDEDMQDGEHLFLDDDDLFDDDDSDEYPDEDPDESADEEYPDEYPDEYHDEVYPDEDPDEEYPDEDPDEEYPDEVPDDLEDTRNVACTNTLPDHSSWAYPNEDGMLTQTFDGSAWVPEADTCVWECYKCFSKASGECIPTILGGGNGTAGEPYIVTTAEHLDEVRCYLSAHFIQTDDIDLSEYSSGEGWVPIGSATKRFAGHYTAQSGSTIINLSINRPSDNYQGLFGYIHTATIEGVSLENINVTGKSNVGALAGIAESSMIEDCHSINGEVTGNNNVGGLVGNNYENSMINRSSSGLVDIDGNESVGGLVGMNYKSNIYRSYSRSYVQGNQFAGGFVGYIMGDTSLKAKVSNCYSRGEVVRKSGVGDSVASFAGFINYGEVEYCYCTGSVDFVGGVNPMNRGFEGGNTGGNTYGSNFFDKETTGQETSVEAAQGKSTVQMQTETTYQGEGWDFENVWDIVTGVNDGYPYLK